MIRTCMLDCTSRIRFSTAADALVRVLPPVPLCLVVRARGSAACARCRCMRACVARSLIGAAKGEDAKIGADMSGLGREFVVVTKCVLAYQIRAWSYGRAASAAALCVGGDRRPALSDGARGPRRCPETATEAIGRRAQA